MTKEPKMITAKDAADEAGVSLASIANAANSKKITSKMENWGQRKVRMVVKDEKFEIYKMLNRKSSQKFKEEAWKH